ncbi:MAG: 4-hydroxybenzoate octaprenyltransferase [Methylophaga sp.]|nr:4-hydroxybenzoate octaprenyltransferase [Methylophaga sp.]
MQNKLLPYIKLMRLDRPIGILLLLWPTLSALWIAAEGKPDLTVLIVFTLGVILMRSAGCVINDYADRKVDGLVFRTASRPLITGALQPKQALQLFAGLGITAFLLVLLLNTMTIWMSFIGLFLAATYPYMKRYTYLPQVYLGAAFGWAIPMAFAAQTNTIPTIAWLLFLANILWATAYDTFYAMADREDDLLAGVKSTAILFGDDDKIIIGVLQLSFLFVMILVGGQLELGLSYYAGICLAAGLSVYQHKITADREPAQCMHAFLNNNWVGAVLFLGIVIHYATI